MIGSMPFRYRQFGVFVAGLGCVVSLLAGCGKEATDETGRLLHSTVLGETGTHLGQFVYPRGMDLFTSEGRSFAAIIDKTARIQIFDLETGQVVGAIKTIEWDQGMPTGLSVGVSMMDPNELAVYVADTHEHRVLVYPLPLPMMDNPAAMDPAFMFGSFGHEPGQFVYPTDIAVRLGDDGRVVELYVSEYGGNDRVSVFTVDTSNPTEPAVAWDRAIGIASVTIDGSDDPRALSRPQSITLRERADGVTELVLTDSSHHRIGRFTLDGELIGWIGGVDDPQEPTMRFPYGITILDDTTALITEFGGCIVRHLDLDTGETLQVFGTPGRGSGQLATPWTTGVIDGKLVVLDSGNSRVQIFEADGITAEQVSMQSTHGRNP